MQQHPILSRPFLSGSGERAPRRLGQLDARALIAMAAVLSSGMVASAWLLTRHPADSRSESAGHVPLQAHSVEALDEPARGPVEFLGSDSPVPADATAGKKDAASAASRMSEASLRSVEALYARVSRPGFRPVGFAEDESNQPAAMTLARRRDYPAIPAGTELLSAFESMATAVGLELAVAPEIAAGLRLCKTSRERRPSTGWEGMQALLDEANRGECVEAVDGCWGGIECLAVDLEGGSLVILPEHQSRRRLVVYDVLDLCLPRLGMTWVPAPDQVGFWGNLGERAEELKYRVMEAIDGDWMDFGQGLGNERAQYVQEGLFEVFARPSVHRAIQQHLAYLRSVDRQMQSSQGDAPTAASASGEGMAVAAPPARATQGTGGSGASPVGPERKAASVPEPLPPPLSADEIANMTLVEAQDALSKVAKARQRGDLDEGTRQRLREEFNLLLLRCKSAGRTGTATTPAGAGSGSGDP